MASMIEEEYQTFTRDGLWKRVFDRIQNEATVLHNFSSKQARSAENRDRNRYRDVSPYDDFRVKLEGCDNNYINASRVEVPLSGRTYILTQGPLANTSGHFWLMVWQQNSRGVLMLNRVIEDGRLKCHPYFPMGSEFGGDDQLTFVDVGIRVEYIKTDNFDYFVVRSLRLVNLLTEEVKQVLQFHYIDWPDFGIPKNSESFLSFLHAVRQSGVVSSSHADANEPGPPVIHCSAGIGRSGTFCLVDSALVQVERTKSLLSLDPRSMLIDMRKYRAGLIQRAEQLQFSYMAILDGAHDALSSPPPSPQANHALDASDEDSDLISDSEISDADTEDTDPMENTTENALDNGPAPPVRTSSLADSQAHSQTDSIDSCPPPKPQRVAHTHVNADTSQNTIDIPDPPTRTTSLHKSASLDEHPPPVPPRPPSTFDRQRSAPSSVPKAEDKQTDAFADDEEHGLDPANRRPIGMYNNPMKRKREMRDERNKNTREMVESMKAKQKAAETAKDSPYIVTHWKLLVGAGVTLLIAAGALYFRPSLLL